MSADWSVRETGPWRACPLWRPRSGGVEEGRDRACRWEWSLLVGRSKEHPPYRLSMETKGTTSPPSPPLEARMKDSFLFANTIQFLCLFHEILNIDRLTPSVRSLGGLSGLLVSHNCRSLRMCSWRRPCRARPIVPFRPFIKSS